ncbi:MAG: hypothetical protein P9F75_10885 [Candidatus Contendobacter sp.]|nr:hypothetical protein [Candidatus Contendobacter sp.]
MAIVADQFDTVITGRIKSEPGLDRAGIGQRGGAGRWTFDPPPPENQRVAVGIARNATIQDNPPADMGDAILVGMSNWRGAAMEPSDSCEDSGSHGKTGQQPWIENRL